MLEFIYAMLDAIHLIEGFECLGDRDKSCKLLGSGMGIGEGIKNNNQMCVFWIACCSEITPISLWLNSSMACFVSLIPFTWLPKKGAPSSRPASFEDVPNGTI